MNFVSCKTQTTKMQLEIRLNRKNLLQAEIADNLLIECHVFDDGINKTHLIKTKYHRSISSTQLRQERKPVLQLRRDKIMAKLNAPKIVKDILQEFEYL